MHGGDDQVSGQIEKVNSKVRFAPNSESSFKCPASINNDSSADITLYDNDIPTPGGLGSSFNVNHPLMDEPLAMQANRTADHFNTAS